MSKKLINKIFIILFAILYTCVCAVSLMHAIQFFGLANSHILSIILAGTFEIGQAAVLFSILTGNGGKNKIIPWLLMIILTSVQVMGNIYSSYKYLIVNNTESLRFFKEPVFIWTNSFPDAQCNVILSYIMGAILPVVALLLTSLVTNYIGVEDKETAQNDQSSPMETAQNSEDNPLETPRDIESNVEPQVIEEQNDGEFNEPQVFNSNEQPPQSEQESRKKSHFINMN